MSRVVTWPYLIGGPGDGKPLPTRYGNGAIYEVRPNVAVLYRELTVDVNTEGSINARCYVYTGESWGRFIQHPEKEALRAMARYALERL
jgi:hypothetical protein